MYAFLSLLIGMLVAVMLVLNGQLTGVTGIYFGTMVIHAVGLLLITVWTCARRGFHKRKKGIPLWNYIGGAIGVGTVVLVNLSFGKISVTAMVALSLFAETVMSILIDRFGWFGAARHPLAKNGVWGLLVICSGIAYMLLPMEGATVLAVAAAFLSGITNLCSRTVNAALTNQYGDALYSTFWNFLTGFAAAVLVWILTGAAPPAAMPSNVLFYCGGAVGIATVSLSVICLKRLSAFYVTLFIFVGQVFTSVALDALLEGRFSLQTLLGGLAVLAGLLLNLLAERRRRG